MNLRKRKKAANKLIESLPWMFGLMMAEINPNITVFKKELKHFDIELLDFLTKYPPNHFHDMLNKIDSWLEKDAKDNYYGKRTYIIGNAKEMFSHIRKKKK